MDFVTGKAAQTVIADRSDRRLCGRMWKQRLICQIKKKSICSQQMKIWSMKRGSSGSRGLQKFLHTVHRQKIVKTKVQQDYIGRCPGNETGTLFSG